jgi:hypothetical protein
MEIFRQLRNANTLTKVDADPLSKQRTAVRLAGKGYAAAA